MSNPFSPHIGTHLAIVPAAPPIPNDYQKFLQRQWLERQERYRVNALAFSRGQERLKQQALIRDELAQALAVKAAEPKPVDKVRKKFLGRAMQIELIQETVAEFYGITRADMLSDKRAPKFSKPRHVAYWLAREKAAAMKHNPAFNPYSYPSLGHRFNRDHSTIIAGVEKIARLLETDEKLSTDIAAIRERLCEQEKNPAA